MVLILVDMPPGPPVTFSLISPWSSALDGHVQTHTHTYTHLGPLHKIPLPQSLVLIITQTMMRSRNIELLFPADERPFLLRLSPKICLQNAGVAVSFSITFKY